VVASLNGVSRGGWVRYASSLEQAGADALELNIYYVSSRPGLSGSEVEWHYLEVVRAVRQAIAIPLAVKLSPARSRAWWVITGGAARFLAVFRVVLGLEFLWAFADKTFGFGYATPSARAWIHGGSPTKGFLSNVAVGPLEGTFHAWAGAGWADWLFMVGLLGIGIALVLGIGLRIAAVSGTLLLVGMWAAEWPLARFTSAGEPSMSTNPLVDYHIVYALALIVVALAYAGHRGGWSAGGPGCRWCSATAG
jgi:thiosulfate dehydrogenase (quinone) large subunit